MEQFPIKILLLEDVQLDVEMACDALTVAGLVFETRHVMLEGDFRAALLEKWPDIIIADYSLPHFDGYTALLLRRELAPDVPFVYFTGSLGEERAVETLRAGATDYVLKHSLQRLPMAVLRALAEADAMRDQARARRELDNERQLLGAVLATAGALIVVLDRNGRIMQINPSAERSIGQSKVDAIGKEFRQLFASVGESEWVGSQLDRLEEHERSDSNYVSWRSTVGHLSVQWSAGRLPGSQAEYAVLAGIDVTEQEIAEQQAYFLRHYDSLTGLPNRALLERRLDQFQPTEGGNLLALILIGVERLADVRDSLGVATGDLLLREISRRLGSWQQAGDWLARVGDNNFALMLEVSDEVELINQLRHLLEQLRKPHRLDDREFFLPAYLGVVVHNNEEHDPAGSLQAAEAALHRAILDQGEGYQLYQSTLSNEAAERLILEGELRLALQGEGQLVLHYQPQADLGSGKVVGLEALVRWNHPRLGLVPPAQFIPLAESCGLIIKLGEQVLRMACHQAAAWQRAGLPPVTVAVNLAAAQWSQSNLLAIVKSALAESGLDPQWLELELTESTSMHDPSATIKVMANLRAMGVHMSIDDFGTGYCNLNYLKRFPVDKLKIDRSFVMEITTDPDDLAISRTVVAIAHQLRLEVVAEGVETEGQLALLADAGCDLIQGYFFSRPLAVEACTALLSAGTTLSAGRRQRYNRTLLMVDDESNILASLRRLLRGSGYQLLTTNSPLEAFELLATHEVGVIVADQRMPELNGTELLNRVKDMYPGTVRMILSGYTDLQTVTDAVNRGAIYKFLTKPWEDDALLAVLEEAFSKYELDRNVAVR
ncbi:EAL domain-containing protein [Chitinimonas arctica]|uniref:EAL domain-containing protein n=1 Tax=Chitinimonas arctica TaxID=2594795 RepID=A0A516SA33_9NEIS|nr:EAL domain-containing protein [Chitinimonas arctica]QDQ25006.1 EAL domain-containing protein [Chitinimonas arctica]